MTDPADEGSRGWVVVAPLVVQDAAEPDNLSGLIILRRLGPGREPNKRGVTSCLQG